MFQTKNILVQSQLEELFILTRLERSNLTLRQNCISIVIKKWETFGQVSLGNVNESTREVGAGD